ncbi:MAG: hypothetical protein PUJ51_25030 [Clostridiales bacterium]|uniref:hypothetical protein n=1 Tax=Terrisporobacter sp. TaxID=1965305 RepID=UPI002A4F6C69|nr:hypothetical protein [Terrisporobacter sp.]MDD7757722.1 hypothetical protein [Clostridiales bacterium]MDY3778343.1 hypothetical protein [Candidatus Onthovivens sp.]MDY4136457.1 hypothetical protein [Terrisporobacter sp.]
MTQNELLEQALDYIDYNLNDDKKFELVINILENLSNYAYENGYNEEANKLTTTILTLKDIKDKHKGAIPLF